MPIRDADARMFEERRDGFEGCPAFQKCDRERIAKTVRVSAVHSGVSFIDIADAKARPTKGLG